MVMDLAAIMRRIAQEKGPEIFDNPIKFKAILEDYAAGQYEGECQNLLVASAQGLFAKIRNAQGSASETINFFASHFSNKLGWTNERAEYIVRICYEAINPTLAEPLTEKAAKAGERGNLRRDEEAAEQRHSEGQKQYNAKQIGRELATTIGKEIGKSILRAVLAGISKTPTGGNTDGRS